LEVQFPDQRCDAEVFTFVPPSALKMPGYSMTATPSLYPGEEITARVVTEAAQSRRGSRSLFVRVYQELEELGLREGPWSDLRRGSRAAALDGAATDGWRSLRWASNSKARHAPGCIWIG